MVFFPTIGASDRLDERASPALLLRHHRVGRCGEMRGEIEERVHLEAAVTREEPSRGIRRVVRSTLRAETLK